MFYTTVKQMHNFVLHYFTLVYISGILPLYNLFNETIYTSLVSKFQQYHIAQNFDRY